MELKDLFKRTRLSEDNCNMTNTEKYNKKMYNHNTDLKCTLDNNYRSICENVGLYQNNKSDKNKKVDDESNLFNGKMGNVMTSKNRVEQLRTRVFPGSPFKKSNIHKINTDIDSKLKKGKLVTTKKSTDKLSGLRMDRFIPLISKIKNNVQNPKHIIPTWTRGGENTRTNLRSIRHN